MESKSDKHLWRVFLIFSLLTLFALIITLNYNSPQIMQLIAHHHYKEIETGFERQSNFACLTVNCQGAVRGIYSKNRPSCSRHYTKSDYFYELKGKKYYVSRYAYTGGTFNCLKGGYTKAYYLPLMPSWSILDNRALNDREIEEVRGSLLYFMYILNGLAAISLVCFFRFKPFALSELFKSDYKISSLIIAAGLPFIILAIVMFFNEFSIIRWLNRDPISFLEPEGLFRIVLMILLYYGLSLVIFYRVFLRGNKLAVLGLPAFVVAHLLFSIVLRIAFAQLRVMF